MGDLRSQAFRMRNIRGSDIVSLTAPFSGFGTSPVGAPSRSWTSRRMQDLSAALRSDDMASVPVGPQVP